MLRTLQIISIAFIWLAICSMGKRILILGETGDGKSTAIKYVFKVIEYVAIGHTFDSETQSVDPYHSSDKSIFAGYEIYDTPGFEATDGMSNDQILELIQVAFATLNKNESSIDGMILIIKSLVNKDRSTKHLTNYLELFGEEMLPNLMVIINRFDSIMNDRAAMEKVFNLKQHVRTALDEIITNSKYYTNTHLKIPIIDVDCNNPTIKEIETVKNKILTLKPYKLRNMNQEKQARIKEIFDEIKANKDNYKDHVENIIVYEMQKVKRHQVVRKTVTMSKKVCGTSPSWSAGIPGLFSISGPPSCTTATELVPQDEIVPIEHEEKVPVNKRNVTKVLKNEELVYWEIAKQKYKKELREQYKKHKQN